MRRPFSSIKRHASYAALGVLLAGLAGCGAASRDNPFAPIVGQSGTLAATARASQHVSHGRGGQNRTQNSSGSSSGVHSGGVNFSDPGNGENPAPALTTE